MPKVKALKTNEKKLVHPHSRKASQMAKKACHLDKIQKKLSERTQKLELLKDKLTWFQEAVEPDKPQYSRAEAEELLQQYLGRFEGELEQLEVLAGVGRRKGRPHAAREDVIRATQQRERDLYNTAGFEIPDVMNAKHLQALRDWGGELRKLQNLKLRCLKPSSSSSSGAPDAPDAPDAPASDVE